jgi:hypothetical protein
MEERNKTMQTAEKETENQVTVQEVEDKINKIIVSLLEVREALAILRDCN